MHYRRLGRTDLHVSAICLGTMTWGFQNTEAEGHAQMDYALDQGINFFDTAEMYAVPPTAETYGTTETIIGTWFAERGNRDKVVLASKAVGPGERFPFVRNGNPRLDRPNITAAVETSLQRLQTDYIDLYQLHWPNRGANIFGALGYTHDPGEDFVHPEETLEVLNDLVTAGKIRHIGLSNETPWGAMTFLQAADGDRWPRAASIQNPYSLLNRTYEIGLAEVSMREDCGLLAYSPLAGGFLSGKYAGGARPSGSRLAVFNQPSRYTTKNGEAAMERYVEIARRYDLDPAQMALAYVNHRPFVTSTIIGATTLPQLAADIASIGVTLDDEALAEIEQVHEDLPNPCP